MIFFVLAIGIAVGWLTAGHFQRKHNKEEKHNRP
jgi:positive regulator of sigma E activity